MDSATQDLYLQKLEEFVYDEDKIVTFKWLCTTLDINVTDSRLLLHQFVTDQRQNKPDDLAVTYIISGSLKKNDLLCISIVKEDELADKRNTFKSIATEFIYSVQKCKTIELTTLCLVDHIDVHKPREKPILGSIISKNCTKRIFKTKTPLPVLQKTELQKGKPNLFASCTSKPLQNTLSKTNTVKETTIRKVKSDVKPQKNGIVGLFSKATAKSDALIRIETIENKEKGKKPQEEKIEEKQSKTIETKDRIRNLADSDSETEDSHTQKHIQEKNKVNKGKKNNKRPRKDAKKNDRSPKRRKRIVEKNDSDSDDIFGNDEGESDRENIVENSDEELDTKSTFKKDATPPPKNKRRKLVDKTFTDEEGYILTRKEWVYESGSESPEEQKNMPQEVKKKEENIEIKNGLNEKKNRSFEGETVNNKPNGGKGKGGKGKKVVASNQPTLMNFFKKN